ncbi:MAG: hypothetical protein KDK39_20030, partial [Leptospiraceae bacterium]|nr:hypothetical protein [Leptospiraceae bacterium]
DLPRIYPHLLHMALNQHGLLVVPPGQQLFYSLDDSELQASEVPLSESIYRPVFAGPDFFVSATNHSLQVLNAAGMRVYQWKLSDLQARQWRVMPLQQADQFAIQGPDSVDIWRYAVPTG